MDMWLNKFYLQASADGGLIVPVIRAAQHLSLAELATQVNDIATLARTRKISADQLRGGA